MTAVVVLRWLDRSVLGLAREIQLSYLPPLMVYLAAGIAGLTGIVGTFFIKDYLDLSAAFLAGLGFWVGIPWALKMPLGHLVDLIWRWKAVLVYVGAALIALSLGIMYGLIAYREIMVAIMPAEAWFVTSVLLSPTGYVIQDVVADAMTVEAVPLLDDQGEPLAEAGPQAHAHHHADTRPDRPDLRHHHRRSFEYRHVCACRHAVRSREGRDLRTHLSACIDYPGRLHSRCQPRPDHASTARATPARPRRR